MDTDAGVWTLSRGDRSDELWVGQRDYGHYSPDLVIVHYLTDRSSPDPAMDELAGELRDALHEFGVQATDGPRPTGGRGGYVFEILLTAGSSVLVQEVLTRVVSRVRDVIRGRRERCSEDWREHDGYR